GARPAPMVNAALPAQRNRIDEERRFDAGITLIEPGVGDVIEEQAQPRIIVEAIGEFAAGLELERAAEVLGAVAAAPPGAHRRFRRDHEVAADFSIEAEAAIAEEGAAVGGEGAEDRADDIEEAIGEAVLEAK